MHFLLLISFGKLGILLLLRSHKLPLHQVVEINIASVPHVILDSRGIELSIRISGQFLLVSRVHHQLLYGCLFVPAYLIEQLCNHEFLTVREDHSYFIDTTQNVGRMVLLHLLVVACVGVHLLVVQVVGRLVECRIKV
jgi:hypothetical protein